MSKKSEESSTKAEELETLIMGAMGFFIIIGLFVSGALLLNMISKSSSIEAHLTLSDGYVLKLNGNKDTITEVLKEIEKD